MGAKKYTPEEVVEILTDARDRVDDPNIHIILGAARLAIMRGDLEEMVAYLTLYTSNFYKDGDIVKRIVN